MRDLSIRANQVRSFVRPRNASKRRHLPGTQTVQDRTDHCRSVKFDQQRLITTNPLTVKEIKQYPASAFEKLNDTPTATSQGRITVAKERGGPFALHYELYGSGPCRIVWLCGHGAGLEVFYQYVRQFGLDSSGRYTSLLLENRGIGRSEAPWSLCTMKELAMDVFDVLDELGWKDDQSVHLVGHSMGGMVAMRMAAEGPSRIASMTLISTTSHWTNDLSLVSAMKTTLSSLIPKSQDRRINDTKDMLFGQNWLHAPDERGIFPTNGDAWTAQFLGWPIHYKGAIVSARACVGHRMYPAEMLAIANRIGGSHIQIVHGRADRMAPVSAAEKTFTEFGGSKSGVQLHLFDDVGHMAPDERAQDVVRLLRDMVGHQ